jgi:hypothetical protein
VPRNVLELPDSLADALVRDSPTPNQGNSQQPCPNLRGIVLLNMNQAALIKRRTELAMRRDAELRACRAKWRSRINSIDLLLKTAATAADSASPTKPGHASSVAVCANGNRRKGKRDGTEGALELVRRTLQRKRGFFTARTLVEFINQSRPTSVTGRGISQPLWSLRQLGEIRLVEKGNGRKPHMYLKL